MGCTDYTCATCRVIGKEKVNFGTCERDGSNYQKNECYGGSFLMSDTFENANGCDGQADSVRYSGICNNDGDYNNEVWIKYDCYVVPSGYKASANAASGNVDANVAIVVAVLSIIGAIGIIVGCLMY